MELEEPTHGALCSHAARQGEADPWGSLPACGLAEWPTPGDGLLPGGPALESIRSLFQGFVCQRVIG